MSLPFSLLALPSEVRLAIYREYFTLPDGYALSPNLRYLTTSAGEPIDLHLMYTCKLVAQETRGLPLTLNTITCSTVHSDYLNLAAKVLVRFCKETGVALNWQLLRLCRFVNRDVCDVVVKKFPYFKRRLEYLQKLAQGEPEEFYFEYAGILPSLLSSPFSEDDHATAHTLQVILSLHDWNVIEQTKPVIREDEIFCYDLSSASLAQKVRMRLDLQDWTIPTHTQVNEMINIYPFLSKIYKDDHRKRRLSAAAAAIFFLNSTPSNTRCQFRRIRLNENGIAVQCPEKHAKGLIPFCLENPHLRIERHVSIWRAIFPAFHVMCRASIKEAIEHHDNKLSVDLAHWFAEVLSLSSQGMPCDSMTTFFDASPAPDLCSQLFQDSVRRDVALIYASKILFPDQIDPALPIKLVAYDVSMSFHDCFDFLELGLENLTDGSTTLRCNFDVGQKWDFNSIKAETTTSNYWDWHSADWCERPHPRYETFSEWVDILREHYFDEDELCESIRNARVDGFPEERDVVDPPRRT